MYLSKSGRETDAKRRVRKTKMSSKDRENARQQIMRMKEESRYPIRSGSSILQKKQRMPHTHLVETRVFCVAEATRFGEEKLFELRRGCMKDVFFEGFSKGKWPESSPFA